ncbi:MAG: acyl carrier protein [Planctomycetota bacterium]|jgi:acyl carrier protein
MDDQEIFAKVQKCVADALGRDEDEVQADKALQRDLEAESIDYLDITFQLEKVFGITIEKDELFPQKIFQDEAYVQDGVVTEQGIEFLKEKLPFADLTEFREDPKVTRVPDLFTVGLLCNYVKTKLSSA